jgi:hypothetical protein
MASATDNRPLQYRAKVQEAQEAAAFETGEVKREALLMATYEEKNPTHNFQSYYPRD